MVREAFPLEDGRVTDSAGVFLAQFSFETKKSFDLKFKKICDLIWF